MKPITLPGIDEYSERHTSPEPPELTAVASDTRVRFQDPQMMSGPVQGAFLATLVHALRARQILEIGAFTGYSAISMARALAPGARLISCEISEAHAAAARHNIKCAGLGDRVTVLTGPVLATIRDLPGPFDLVFIDADKTEYLQCFEGVLPKLSDHGVIAADNTLWNGEVLYEKSTDRDVLALRTFNEAVAADPRVECVLLTIRDGITLIRKRAQPKH